MKNFEDRFIARLFSAAALLTGSAVITPTAFAVSSVNKSVHVPAAGQDGDVSSVNGGVSIGERAVVADVSSVNGGIDLGQGAVVDSVESVNGGIDGAADVQIKGDVESVNGGIEFGTGARISGDVQSVNGGVEFAAAQIRGGISTVNGSIELNGGQVGAGLETVWGSIELEAGATIGGDITVRKPKGNNWFNRQRKPKIVLGPDVEVVGRIVLEHEAEVYVHDTAKVGGIVGGEIKRYSGVTP